MKNDTPYRKAAKSKIVKTEMAPDRLTTSQTAQIKTTPIPAENPKILLPPDVNLFTAMFYLLPSLEYLLRTIKGFCA